MSIRKVGAFMERIKSAVVIFNDPRIGSYALFEDGGISGVPFPSEGQAWAFGKGIALLEKFMSMGYQNQLDLLKQLNIS